MKKSYRLTNIFGDTRDIKVFDSLEEAEHYAKEQGLFIGEVL